MTSNTYRPYTCRDCGDALSAREVAYEFSTYIEGTAQTRKRGTFRFCIECHAVNEWKRQQAIEADPQRRQGLDAKKRFERGEYATLHEALTAVEAEWAEVEVK
jgi:hypothetical protein